MELNTDGRAKSKLPRKDYEVWYLCIVWNLDNLIHQGKQKTVQGKECLS